MLAMLLLAFSVVGLAIIFPVGLRLGNASQMSSETLRLAQKELDQIRVNAFDLSGSFTDVDGNTVDVACSGTPGTSCGCPLNSSGNIDFSQAPAVGFSAQLTDSFGRAYSVRWNLTVTASEGRKILVAAEPVGYAGAIVGAVQLKTLVVQQ